MRKFMIVTIAISLLSVVGCAGGNGNNVINRNAPKGPGSEKTITTFAGEYELVVNYDCDELYVYKLPGRDENYGPIPYEFSSPSEAFILENPDKVYIHTSAGMSYGDLLEVSLEDKAVKRIDHCTALIDYSPEGTWVAYNRMHDLSHELNPGENWDACSQYIVPYDIEEGGPMHLGNPPLGSSVYFQYPGEVKPLFTVTASSTLAEPGKPGDYFGADKLTDGSRSTAWAEGVDGLGVGEWIKLTAAVPVSIRGIKVWGGFAESAASMKGNAHPTKISVILNDDNKAGYIEFPPPADSEYSDYFGEWRYDPDSWETKTHAETIRLTIEEVKPGTKWEDCCISEIEVW